MKLNKKISKLVVKAKKSSIFIFVGIVLFLLTAVITIAQGGEALKSLYFNSDLGYKSQLIKNINNLSAGVNIAVFEDYFGHPIFKTKNNEKEIFEYIFINKFCYIQAFTDLDESVLAYSVTTREKNFNPELVIPLQEELLLNGEYSKPIDVSVRVKLGKTKFSELYDPVEIISNLGAHDFYYSEQYYYGNPGLYQTYFFTLNEMGYISTTEIIKDYEFHNADDYNAPIDKDEEDVKIFRNNSSINTFTVTAPGVGLSDDVFQEIEFGPDKYQTRVLK